jgi:hypothetical protein
VLNATTEMVVVRNGVVIAELDNVEEVTINTAGGADTTAAIGNFNPSSLFFNTVTVNGGTGPDSIDSTQLTSAHRLVLNQAGTVAAVQPTAPAAVPAADPFPGVGQSLIDALGSQGLLDSGRDGPGFLGSRHNGTLVADLMGYDHGRGRHFYEMTHDLDFAPSADSASHPQALHFDAADHLIS